MAVFRYGAPSTGLKSGGQEKTAATVSFAVSALYVTSSTLTSNNNLMQWISPSKTTSTTAGIKISAPKSGLYLRYGQSLYAHPMARLMTDNNIPYYREIPTYPTSQSLFLNNNMVTLHAVGADSLFAGVHIPLNPFRSAYMARYVGVAPPDIDEAIVTLNLYGGQSSVHLSTWRPQPTLCSAYGSTQVVRGPILTNDGYRGLSTASMYVDPKDRTLRNTTMFTNDTLMSFYNLYGGHFQGFASVSSTVLQDIISQNAQAVVEVTPMARAFPGYQFLPYETCSEIVDGDESLKWKGVAVGDTYGSTPDYFITNPAEWLFVPWLDSNGEEIKYTFGTECVCEYEGECSTPVLDDDIYYNYARGPFKYNEYKPGYFIHKAARRPVQWSNGYLNNILQSKNPGAVSVEPYLPNAPFSSYNSACSIANHTPEPLRAGLLIENGGCDILQYHPEIHDVTYSHVYTHGAIPAMEYTSAFYNSYYNPYTFNMGAFSSGVPSVGHSVKKVYSSGLDTLFGFMSNSTVKMFLPSSVAGAANNILSNCSAVSFKSWGIASETSGQVYNTAVSTGVHYMNGVEYTDSDFICYHRNIPYFDYRVTVPSDTANIQAFTRIEHKKWPVSSPGYDNDPIRSQMYAMLLPCDNSVVWSGNRATPLDSPTASITRGGTKESFYIYEKSAYSIATPTYYVGSGNIYTSAGSTGSMYETDEWVNSYHMHPPMNVSGLEGENPTTFTSVAATSVYTVYGREKYYYTLVEGDEENVSYGPTSSICVMSGVTLSNYTNIVQRYNFPTNYLYYNSLWASSLYWSSRRNALSTSYAADLYGAFISGQFTEVCQPKYSTGISASYKTPTAAYCGQFMFPIALEGNMKSFGVSDACLFDSFTKTLPTGWSSATKTWVDPAISGNSSLATYGGNYYMSAFMLSNQYAAPYISCIALPLAAISNSDFISKATDSTRGLDLPTGPQLCINWGMCSGYVYGILQMPVGPAIGNPLYMLENTLSRQGTGATLAEYNANVASVVAYNSVVFARPNYTYYMSTNYLNMPTKCATQGFNAYALSCTTNNLNAKYIAYGIYGLAMEHMNNSGNIGLYSGGTYITVPMPEIFSLNSYGWLGLTESGASCFLSNTLAGMTAGYRNLVKFL